MGKVVVMEKVKVEERAPENHHSFLTNFQCNRCNLNKRQS